MHSLPLPTAAWKEMDTALRHFVRGQLHDPDIAQDIVQEVWLKVYTRRAQLRDTDKVSAWIWQIARHTLIDHFRTKRSQAPEHALRHLAMPSNGEGNLTEAFAECIRPMIMTLPPIYQEALLLSEIEGIPQKELAERLGISYSGAKSRVQRGRALLKETLLQCCDITLDTYGNVVAYTPRNKPSTSCD